MIKEVIDESKFIYVDIRKKLEQIYKDCNNCRVHDIQIKIGDLLKETEDKDIWILNKIKDGDF